MVAIIAIWGTLIINLILTVAGYTWYLQEVPKPDKNLPEEIPFVTVMVPAHNEGIVIVKTVLSLLSFDYPHDRYEIIVINDNSSDNSAELLRGVQKDFGEERLKVINTDNVTGGKGKSNALNIGLKQAKGSVIAVYDADNTPERSALRLLVAELLQSDRLAAVIGKFRTRNKEATVLTRFINIETFRFNGWLKQDDKGYLSYALSQELIMLLEGKFWKRLADGMLKP
jgi:cellulose synthase/poly-beta-1,6-N-acetylglucosamine synthase-like glycosyltransferase